MFLRYYLVKIFYVISLFFAAFFNAQSYSSFNELDSLTDNLRTTGKINESIELNKNAIKKFEKQKNTDGLIAAYINMGGLLWYLHRYKESLEYLENAEEKLRKIKNLDLCAKLYSEYGRNYASLGLLEQSNSNLNTSIYFAKQISDKKKREKLLYFYYTWKLANFEELHITDSINVIQKKRLELSAQPLTFVHIAEKHLKNKQLDTAEHYLNKAMSLTGDYSLYQKSMTLLAFGKLYTERKNYEKALEYYHQSLIISKQLSRKNDIRNAYKLISDTYKRLNNIEKKNEYLEKYSYLSDSIEKDERNALDIPVKKILKKESQKEQEETTKYYIIILLIITTAGIILFLLIKAYQKKQKLKDEIIDEKLSETEELKQKLSTTGFDELSKLAMANDPFFLTRFKEIYPDFYTKLTGKYPHLSTNDIKFSAFLKLNLSTKTIAQYKNISIRTIESRKYRLRKKLDLPSDVDLNKWMMEL
jgi:tetratricopeptide (TPR) repeat protein